MNYLFYPLEGQKYFNNLDCQNIHVGHKAPFSEVPMKLSFYLEGIIKRDLEKQNKIKCKKKKKVILKAGVQKLLITHPAEKIHVIAI